jgi:hypothetical protein
MHETHWLRVFAIWIHRIRIRDDGPVTPVFDACAQGIPIGMQDSEELPDDVPVADAVEQQRPPNEPVPDEEASAEPPLDMPLEAAPADWQDQLETVELDSEIDEPDRSNGPD